ncbi:MAG: GGDEF domain-containing protein [Alcanivorax jadensis]|uniref:GGDEF domain-containing protein n=1 Tax=Alcanivorax jadensis TaxID=64988 RepID=UPI003002FBE3
MTQQPELSSSLPEDTDTHSWLSNPLDWPHIDRMILLASLVLICPVALGGWLIGVAWVAPDWVNRPVVYALLTLFGCHILLLGSFLLAAHYRRRKHSHWSRMESVIIFSYALVCLTSSWLTGTQFTAGLLLLLLGVNIASPLASIHKLKRAYGLVYIGLAIFIVMYLSGNFSHAPLFSRPPYQADGSPVMFWFVFESVLAITLLVILYIGLIVTERWSNREDLYREMSTVDGLTRLTNRRYFIERGESEFNRTQRTPTAQLSCIMLDIDHFKLINDTHGHDAGDAVLVKISEIMMDNARQYDEVGRYGGEEFAILLPATPLENAYKVAERLRTRIAAAEIQCNGQTLNVTASFGVACYPYNDIQDMNGLLKAADTALYAAKHGGRNQVVTAREQQLAASG